MTDTPIATTQAADDALAEACILIDAVRAFLNTTSHDVKDDLDEAITMLQAARDEIA